MKRRQSKLQVLNFNRNRGLGQLHFMLNSIHSTSGMMEEVPLTITERVKLHNISESLEDLISKWKENRKDAIDTKIGEDE